jgi:hypothetical protein
MRIELLKVPIFIVFLSAVFIFGFSSDRLIAAPGMPFRAPQRVDWTKKPIASFDEVMNLAKDVKRGRIAERRVLQKIQNGRLLFTPTNEQVQQLQAAGASERIVDAIREWVPPPPKPPPPPQPGTFSVLCQPIDCSISIDGSYTGKTEGGKSPLLEVPPGDHKLAAAAQGYETDQPERSATVGSGATITLIFRFTPTRQTLEAAGKQIYDRLVNALGGEAVLKDSNRFRASGTLTLSDRDGNQSVWEATIYYRSPDRAKFLLRRANHTYTVFYTGQEGYQWKKKAPQEAASLEDVLFRTCEFQIANMLRRLGSPPFTLVSNRPVFGPESTLRAEGSPDSYFVSFDAAPHVTELRAEASGLNKGMRAVYGEYTEKTDHGYARRTQVLFPDKRGVELRAADLVYNPPDMDDTTFVVKAPKKRE